MRKSILISVVALFGVYGVAIYFLNKSGELTRDEAGGMALRAVSSYVSDNCGVASGERVNVRLAPAIWLQQHDNKSGDFSAKVEIYVDNALVETSNLALTKEFNLIFARVPGWDYYTIPRCELINAALGARKK